LLSQLIEARLNFLYLLLSRLGTRLKLFNICRLQTRLLNLCADFFFSLIVEIYPPPIRHPQFIRFSIHNPFPNPRSSASPCYPILMSIFFAFCSVRFGSRICKTPSLYSAPIFP
jgi:hypothetical protein